ncbi:MAG: hypothetical protein ACYCTB_05530 [bacterium]
MNYRKTIDKNGRVGVAKYLILNYFFKYIIVRNTNKKYISYEGGDSIFKFKNLKRKKKSRTKKTKKKIEELEKEFKNQEKSENKLYIIADN